LAPGATPAIARDDGAILAPVAHLFEHQVAASLAAFDGQWTLAAVVSCWSTYAALLQQRPSPFSPLDDVVELHRWLSAAATAGHLEALVVNAFGAHFQTERASYESAHPGALDAARTWAVTHSFRPIHAVLPDDLVRIR
jgi:hypothetical protein